MTKLKIIMKKVKKGKEVYDKVKNYYEEGKDIYNKYFKKDKTQEEQRQEYLEEEKYRKQQYQEQQQRLSQLEQQRKQKLRQQEQQIQQRLIQQQQQAKRQTTVQELEKNLALKKYEELKSNNIMNSYTKKLEINNHLNYMLSRGFITPSQRQQMSI